jgi:hypothetical protein
MPIHNLALCESQSLRNQSIKDFSQDKALEALSKAKALVMAVWQGTGIATTEQIAEYFGVSADTIQDLIRRHRVELQSDGLQVVRGKDLKDVVLAINTTSNKSPNLTVWTPRATLRCGMLLRDSEIAKQLRSTILNIVEQVPQSIQKPRLKIVDRDVPIDEHISVLRMLLDLNPTLDSNRKAVIVYSSVAQKHPEYKDFVNTAQSLLPPSAPTEQSYTPTEIGQKLSPQLSPRQVNNLLEQIGLQTRYFTASNRQKWQSTDRGLEYAVLTIEAKSNGAPTESLRWKISVVDLLSIREVV